MLEIIRDEQGNMQAVCEFNRVDKDGKLDKQGRYIYIANMEINPSARGNGMLKKFIKLVSDRIKDFDACYFKREKKYNGRLRMYTRQQWLNQLKER